MLDERPESNRDRSLKKIEFRITGSYYSPKRMVLIIKKKRKIKMPKKLLAYSKKDISGRTFADPFVSLCITIGVLVFHLFCICLPGALYLLIYLLCISCCPARKI